MPCTRRPGVLEPSQRPAGQRLAEHCRRRGALATLRSRMAGSDVFDRPVPTFWVQTCDAKVVELAPFQRSNAQPWSGQASPAHLLALLALRPAEWVSL